MIDLILFDIGGVLIELGGVPKMLEWTDGRMDESELWRRWLTSPVVRRFETGRCTADEFGDEIIAEFRLPVGPREFLREFASWPKGLFPGATSLLRKLSGRFVLANLCNTNELYWSRIQATGVLDHFTFSFPSHLIGVLKPDAAAFRHVLDVVPSPPERILFLDDNQLNVDGARAVGIHARRAVGFEGLRTCLDALGILRRSDDTASYGADDDGQA